MADELGFSKKQGQGVPNIKTDPMNFGGTNKFSIVSTGSDSKNKLDGDNNFEAILMIMTLINVICILIFLPTNCKMTKGILQISTKKQPMFLFFVGVQLSCIADLLTCVVDVVLLWTEAPDAICTVLGGFTMSIYCFLSLMIASICFYR